MCILPETTFGAELPLGTFPRGNSRNLERKWVVAAILMKHASHEVHAFMATVGWLLVGWLEDTRLLCQALTRHLLEQVRKRQP